MASDDVVLPITQPLLTSLLSALKQAETPTDLRQFFYICIGLIAHRNPTLIQKNIDVLRFLFEAAIHEPASIKVSITECLSMVFPAVQNPPPEVEQELLSLIQNAVQNAPSVAAKFAFAFPFSIVPAKGVCLRVLNQFGLSSDLAQSARYALDPYYFKLTTQVSRNVLPPEFYTFPSFSEAVAGLVGLDGIDVVETLRFLRIAWLHEALGDAFKFDEEEWRDRLDTAIEVDDVVRNSIKLVLRKWTQERHSGLERYFEYLRYTLANGNDEQVSVAAAQLLELVTLGGKDISTALLPDTNAIKDLVFSQNELLREKSAQLLGIIGTNSTNVESMVRGLLRFAEGSVERQHGAVLAVGSILGRLAMQGKLSVISTDIQQKFATDVAQIIVSMNTNTILLEAGLQALSELCIFGAGTLFQASQREEIISRLQTLSKSARHGNLQDRAVLTLGYLSFSIAIPDDEAAVIKILDALYAVHEQKQVELLFSAGQALSCVAARWNSKAMTPFRYADVDMRQEPVPQILDRVLNSILEGVGSPKHPLRKVCRCFPLVDVGCEYLASQYPPIL
jgi:proteasome component ECM29